jgi:hypothetical protein
LLRTVTLSFALLSSSAWLAACASPRGLPASAPAASGASQGQLFCTYTYGGEAKRVPIAATRDPYRVAPLKIETRFELKVVYVDAPADVAGVRVYTYYPGPDAPVLIHEAKYPLRGPGRAPYGFTGKQLVYEPRGGELEYFCEWSDR